MPNVSTNGLVSVGLSPRGFFIFAIYKKHFLQNNAILKYQIYKKMEFLNITSDRHIQHTNTDFIRYFVLKYCV